MSHRLLWKKVLREYSSAGDGKGGTDTGPDVKLSSYSDVMDKIRQMEPYEFVGEPGDCLFWHHRLCHSAGQNFSGNIRMSCLYDFAQWRMALTEEDGHLAEGSELDRPPTDAMWRDWTAAVQATAADVGPLEPSAAAKM
eukprot:SAG22_NODE_492_length_9824_cov_12.256864_13_plen_139_part_00